MTIQERAFQSPVISTDPIPVGPVLVDSRAPATLFFLGVAIVLAAIAAVGGAAFLIGEKTGIIDRVDWL